MLPFALLVVWRRRREGHGQPYPNTICRQVPRVRRDGHRQQVPARAWAARRWSCRFGCAGAAAPTLRPLFRLYPARRQRAGQLPPLPLTGAPSAAGSGSRRTTQAGARVASSARGERRTRHALDERVCVALAHAKSKRVVRNDCRRATGSPSAPAARSPRHDASAGRIGAPDRVREQNRKTRPRPPPGHILVLGTPVS